MTIDISLIFIPTRFPQMSANVKRDRVGFGRDLDARRSSGYETEPACPLPGLSQQHLSVKGKHRILMRISAVPLKVPA